MKCELDELGLLSIRAESPIETYALRHWWDCYTANPSTATLKIELVNREGDRLHSLSREGQP